MLVTTPFRKWRTITSSRLWIEDNFCTFSVDTSGASLHKRGYKEAVGKAPLRETLAALFLRECGFSGDEPLVDPMCGSGTFVIEAAERALGLHPGRARSFAFEDLASFDPDAWAALREAEGPVIGGGGQRLPPCRPRSYLQDRPYPQAG